MQKQRPVAVIVGVGPGLGAALCRKLAAAGYAVAGMARGSGFGEQLTATVKAGASFAAFASFNFALRGLAQSMAREVVLCLGAAWAEQGTVSETRGHRRDLPAAHPSGPHGVDPGAGHSA